MYPYLVLAYAWLAAFGAAYFVTNASLLFPLRIRIHERQRLLAVRRAGDIHSAPPDTPASVRNALRTRYWLRRAFQEHPFCMVCVGLDAWLIGVAVAWIHLGWPAQVWGAPAWLSIPAALTLGWLLMLLVTNLLPSVGMLTDYHNVEDGSGATS